MDLLDTLLEHRRWATLTLLEFSRDLSDQQLDQHFDVGLRTLSATFDHMISTVDFWTALMAGRRPVAAPSGDHSVAALIDRHEASDAAFASLSRQLRDQQRLEDTYIDHYNARKSFLGTIVHVVFHGEEHRTEARHILKRLGLPDVPEVDPGLWDYERLNP